MSAVEHAAAEIIKLLNRRGGFDEWWDQVAKDDKKDILGELEDIIGNTHDP